MTDAPKPTGSQLRPREELLALIDGVVSKAMSRPGSVSILELLSPLSEAAERIRAAARSEPPAAGVVEALRKALEEIIAADTYVDYKYWRGVRSSAVTEGHCAEIARAALAHPPASGD